MLLVQVDWVAEFADLGMIEPLDERIAKEPKEFLDNIPKTFHQTMARQAVLPADRKRRRRAVLQHRAVQGGRPVRAAQDLGRVRGDRAQADEPGQATVRHHGDAARRAADEHDL